MTQQQSLRPVTPVSILAAELNDLCRELDDGLIPRHRARLQAAAELAAGIDPYLERCTSPESPALRRLTERTRAHAWRGTLEAEMLSGHVEGQFLAMLVHATRAARVLEIGMFTGYSALAMAEALPEGGRLVACELDAGVAALARECFDASPVGDRIDIRVGPALATLGELEGQAFDLVFLDADKPGYAGYLAALLDGGLLAPHGLLCVDNTLLQGQPWSPDPTANGRAIAAFNASVADDPRIVQVLVPLRDGITLIRRVVC